MKIKTKIRTSSFNDKANESDQSGAFAQLLTEATELFEGDKSLALQWLSQPNPALGQRSPLDMAATATGACEVKDLIGRLEHGVFS